MKKRKNIKLIALGVIVFSLVVGVAIYSSSNGKMFQGMLRLNPLEGERQVSESGPVPVDITPSNEPNLPDVVSDQVVDVPATEEVIAPIAQSEVTRPEVSLPEISAVTTPGGEIINNVDVVPPDEKILQNMREVLHSQGEEAAQVQVDNGTGSESATGEEMFEKIEGLPLPFPTVKEDVAASIHLGVGEVPPISSSTWNHLGIQGIGLIRALDADSQNSAHLLMATSTHVYETYDFGQTWLQLDFPPNAIGSVAIDPNNKDHYLVGCQKSLYESKDAGKTWALNYQFKGVDLYQDAINTIFWSDKTIYLYAGKNTALSTDNGVSWQSNFFLPLERGHVKMTKNGFGLAVNPTEIYKTNDFGKSWVKIFTISSQMEENFSFASFDISDDGQLILASVSGKGTPSIYVYQSVDGGETYKVMVEKGEFGVGPQDMMIDALNQNHITMFAYMQGLYESYDKGENFSKVTVTGNYIDVAALGNGLVIPMDLRYNALKKVLINNHVTYLIPSDQGLFTFDAESSDLRNLAPSLYMADTGLDIGATSCGWIYSGIWHVGSFMIRPDGITTGDNWGEKNHAALGKDLGCSTSVVLSGVYPMQYIGAMGKELIVPVNMLSTPMYLQPYDGWWYAVVHDVLKNSQDLVRYDGAFKNKEILSKPNVIHFVYYIDKNGNSPVYWLLDKDSTKGVWKSEDLKTWTKNPADCDCYATDIFADGNILAISTLNGLFVSNDQGKTLTKFFPHMSTSRVVEDSLGRMFVGTGPSLWDPDSDGKNMSGVWYSTDHGKTWNRFGNGTENSWVTGLTVDNFTNTLYASTNDDSLMRIKLGPKVNVGGGPVLIQNNNSL